MAVPPALGPISLARGNPMKKVLFNLTDEQNERLERLAKSMGVSKSEALRRTIELYVMFKEAKVEGAQFTREDKDGTRRLVEIIG
jgi:predicted DNA-binding protein